LLWKKGDRHPSECGKKRNVKHASFRTHAPQIDMADEEELRVVLDEREAGVHHTNKGMPLEHRKKSPRNDRRAA